tara:strand:- start:9993 stop:10994 length:1002 start_codon:yes stop_codon:yes gene_type:complete
MSTETLKSVITKISAHGKGILAADESTPTITKRFKSIDLDCNEQNRQAYRELLFTTPNLGQYISGVILFEETLHQQSQNQVPFVEILSQQGIVPGIKVDKGLIPLINSSDEQVTQGLDGLPERLAKYKDAGAQFAKWRAIFKISPQTPSQLLTLTNANNLARYAAICQSLDIVPIVEPEILIDGEHDIETCAHITENVLNAVFDALTFNKVQLEFIILKPSMILPGNTCATKAKPNEIAQATIDVFRRTVPAAVPSINFLSGGQTPNEATINLNAINQLQPQPWNLSFSYGRALQEPVLNTWHGKQDNIQKAQAALIEVAKSNTEASLGRFGK